MASIGHIAVGLAAARAKDRRLTFSTATLFSAMAMLPDLDVLGFALGVPYGSTWGHRGALHSMVAAGALALTIAFLTIKPNESLGRWVGWLFLVTVSHGFLDTLTDGGKGVALLWPWSSVRYFAPWRPIPVAPIGFRILSPRGLWVLARESFEFLPLLVFAAWPGRKTPKAP